ncbi:MAG TPA: ABC transporter permease [Candidatus Acidoferrales bacterium]|nr:ABC transporter permease [Candidatus Acidoferrales bacterium]
MSAAAYLDPTVSLDPGTRTAHADFEIRNDSAQVWRAAEGFGVGYHLFDAETGTLIVDGARVHPARDLTPGESERVHLDFELPAEDGRYQVLVSPMRENVCWYYEQGWPFLLLEGSTRDGESRVDRVRVVTRATLSRERALRSLGRAFVLPVRTIWRNRGLIRVMVRRDILGRYRGSFGGAFWTVINPLLLMLTYFFVFGVFLRSRFGADTSTSSFALYFLAGMLPWLAFSEAAGRAPTVMLEHSNFVKKLVFAVETLPVNLVAAGLVTELFAVVLYCGFLLVARGQVPATVFWLPVLLVPQVLFTAGIAWFLAGLGVFARDLGQIMGFVLTVWFFTTPICYPETQWPASAAAVLTKNPIYVLVRGYRAIFLEYHSPAFGSLWKLYLLSAAIFILGHAWFYKLRKSFPDML